VQSRASLSVPISVVTMLHVVGIAHRLSQYLKVSKEII